MHSRAEPENKLIQRFQLRIDHIRHAMRDRALDFILIYKPTGEHYAYGGIGYARFVMVPWIAVPLPQAFIMIPARGEVICFLLEGLGAQHLHREVPGLRVEAEVPMTEMRRNIAPGIVQRIASTIQDLGGDTRRIGIVLYSELPLWIHERLTLLLPNVIFSDATDLLDDLMAVKSHDEIEHIRAASMLADKAFARIFSVMRPDISESEAVAEAQYEVLKGGASYANVRVSTGKPSDPRGGVRPASDKRAESGDHIHVGVDLAYKDYWVNVVRRGVVGRPTADHQALFRVAIAMQDAALAQMKPGAPVSNAFCAAYDVVEDARKSGLFESFKLQRLGHGIGHENQERPFLSKTEEMVFRPNMTFALHPGYLVPTRGQVANGDIVLITEEGPQLLTHFPRVLVEAG